MRRGDSEREESALLSNGLDKRGGASRSAQVFQPWLATSFQASLGVSRCRDGTWRQEDGDLLRGLAKKRRRKVAGAWRMLPEAEGGPREEQQAAG